MTKMAVVTQSNVRYSSIVHNVSRNINREQELNQIIQHVIKSDNDSTVLPYQNVTASRGDVVTAGFSTFASIHSYSIHSLVCNLLSWWLARLVGGHSSQLACSAVGGSVALGHADFFGTAGQFSIGANSHLLLPESVFEFR
jgi:hypothetical protein